MLEFRGDHEEARKVLTNYAYDDKFPSNPNAHIYLYNFLKREKAPRAKLLSVLKVWKFQLHVWTALCVCVCGWVYVKTQTTVIASTENHTTWTVLWGKQKGPVSAGSHCPRLSRVQYLGIPFPLLFESSVVMYCEGQLFWNNLYIVSVPGCILTNI